MAAACLREVARIAEGSETAASLDWCEDFEVQTPSTFANSVLFRYKIVNFCRCGSATLGRVWGADTAASLDWCEDLEVQTQRPIAKC